MLQKSDQYVTTRYRAAHFPIEVGCLKPAMATSILTSPNTICGAIKRAIALSPARIAVPFWGWGALKALGLERSQTAGVRILCNLSVGGCNPDVIRDLIKRGFQVRALASLHAKVYLGPTSAVLGSANASADGLGLNKDGSGWNEACTLIDGPDEISQLTAWFDSLWENAADLSIPVIAQILLEQADRAPPALRVDPLDLLSAVKENPKAFAMKSLFISLDYEPYSRKVERKVAQLQEELGSGIDAWENWTKMPPAAEILSFYYDLPSDKISFEGIYQSPKDPAGSMDPKTNGIFVTQARRALGTYGIGDERAWCRAVKRWQRAVFVNGKAKDDDLLLSLSEFTTKYLP